MKKSPSDHKQYQLHTLNNGVKLLHVEDKASSSCAIALKLNSGSFSDPENCPGLAHLLEHCLFTGSRQYPQDNSLTQYLDAHQGQLNAWTATESSAWYFKVHAPFFAEALDIFFDMLLQPLFSLSGIEKELSAIDSEFKNKITEEQRRILDVQKQTVNPTHPFSRFSVGNHDIFKHFSHKELQSLLQDFWQTTFVAGNISVCVSTPENGDECINYVIEELLKFKSGQSPSLSLPALYQNAQLNKHIRVHTKRTHQRLVVIFNLNEEELRGGQLDYHLKNDALLSHLFGYEGQGSLLHFWKSQQWATQVIAGIGLSGSNFADFNLYIELTESGLNRVTEILQSVLYFANLIKTSTNVSAHYQEKARLNQLAFQYQEAQSSLDTVRHLVKNLSQFPANELLTAEYEMQGYKETAMHRLLQNMQASQMRVISISSGYDIKNMAGGQYTPWYKVPYAVSDVNLPDTSDSFLQELEASLHLPPPNGYIPEETPPPESLQDHPERHPGGKARIWIASNTVSSDAKGECFLSWSKPNGFNSLESVARRKLFCSAMESKLNERFYPAQLAGIHYSFYSHQNGAGLHTSGFAQKQLMLCRDIIERLQRRPGDCPDFQLHKQEYLNTLLSSVRNKPLNRLFTALQSLCVSASWLPEDLARVAMSTQQADIEEVHQQLFQNFQLEGMVYGHWDKNDLNAFVADIDVSSQGGDHELSAQQPGKQKTILLSQSGFRSLNFPCNHNDAALVVYLQSPAKNLQQQAKTMLAETLLAGFYFNWMRNQKQLGYQVGTGYMPFNEHPGIAMYVQSSTVSPINLYRETKMCMTAFYQWLVSLNAQQWQNYHHSLIRQLSGNKVNFAVRCQRYWSAIGRDPVDFEFELHLQQAVSDIELNTLADWFKQHFLDIDADFSLYTAGDKDHQDSDFDKPLPSIYQFK